MQELDIHYNWSNTRLTYVIIGRAVCDLHNVNAGIVLSGVT